MDCFGFRTSLSGSPGGPSIREHSTAIAARFWAYHRWYDDLLLLFPMVALFRIAKSSRRGETTGTWACVLFALTLAPGGLYVLPDAWRPANLMSQTMIWAGALVFLVSTEKPNGRSEAGS